MIASGLLAHLSRGSVILCIGAHSDDIEIGCFGTIQKLVKESDDLTVCWVVLAAKGIREAEARASAEEIIGSTEDSKIIIKNFRNGYFPYVATEIKDYFETLKQLPNPDLILTHSREDLHQDHRLVGELTWNTYRNHLILEYEIPKYDGDTGSPNAFVPLSKEEMNAKLDHLARHFESQHDKQWYSSDTFSGLSRLRGIECNAPSGAAEAFYARKLVL
jgi:LmbE family N-acetylglucosaminyl deacetylase